MENKLLQLLQMNIFQKKYLDLRAWSHFYDKLRHQNSEEAASKSITALHISFRILLSIPN